MSEHLSFTYGFVPEGEPIPGKTYRADGWAYVDLPTKFSIEMWDLFLSIIGGENYVLLAESRGPDWARGQLLVSPDGQANMQAYSDAQKKKAAT